jgi:ribosomal protein S18 acetylase RimI-like enzyme
MLTRLLLAFYNELPVGAVRCALETPQNHNQPTKIYIMTLAVLAPYRGYGIGTKLLDHIIEQAKEMYVHDVYVHVLATDEDAIQWYEKRGFDKGDLVKEYYKTMQPRGDAYVMSKKI